MALSQHDSAPATSLERRGYLFGKKITNSLSPELHDIIYAELGLPWAQTRLDSDDIPYFLELLKRPETYGASVTMPNKVAIMQHLDSVTEECRDVGACNTVYFQTSPSGIRTTCGTNTDVIGVRDSFYRNVSDPDAVFHGRPALVLGGGGAARSAVYALRKYMRVTDIYLVNRLASEVEAVVEWCRSRGYGDGLVHVTSVEQARALAAPGAVVACIPDFPPRTAEEKLAREVFETLLKKERKGAMLEMCYNPTPWTELSAFAEREGWRVIPGTEALIWQGLEQDRYWTGKQTSELPVAKVQEFVASKLHKGPKL